MSQNLSINPYFDPNPRWYFNSLTALAVISIIVYAQAVYVILRHSPKIVTTDFKYLLVGHLTTATGFELISTTLCPLLIYLPFTAGEGKGLLTYLGVGMDHQIVLLFTSVLAALSVVLPLFYYRMRCLLPPNHFVNRKSVHYSVNSIMYICSYILPIPPIYLSIHYQDSNEVKHYYETTYSMTFPDLYSPQVAAIIPSNPWAIVCGIGIFLACFLQALIIFGCTYFSYQSLKKVSSSLSITTKKHHINLLKSLTAMIVALGLLVIVVVPLLASLFLFNSARTDIACFLIVLGTAVIPIAEIAYTVNYTPYRQFYMKGIRYVFNINKYKTTPHLTIISTA